MLYCLVQNLFHTIFGADAFAPRCKQVFFEGLGVLANAHHVCAPVPALDFLISCGTAAFCQEIIRGCLFIREVFVGAP